MPISESQNFRIEQLGSQHDRKNFCCGIDTLDKYFRTQAGQDLRNKVAVHSCFSRRILLPIIILCQIQVSRLRNSHKGYKKSFLNIPLFLLLSLVD